MIPSFLPSQLVLNWFPKKSKTIERESKRCIRLGSKRRLISLRVGSITGLRLRLLRIF